MPNKCTSTFISGKVCLLGSIEGRGLTLPEINVHAHLFGTLEYLTPEEIIIEEYLSTLLMENLYLPSNSTVKLKQSTAAAVSERSIFRCKNKDGKTNLDLCFSSNFR